MSCDLHICCTDCDAKLECEFSDIDADEVEERIDPFWFFLCKQFEEERAELL